MPEEAIYLIAAFVLIGGVVLYLVLKYEQGRREVIQEFAGRIGFSYEKKFKPGPELLDFKLFKRGHSRRASNLVSGSRGGIAYELFDYRFTRGGGQGSHIIRQTVIFARLTRTDLPQFILAPENFFHKIGRKMGLKDINFEQFPGFSDFYLLRGEDEAAVRELFKPRLLEYFQSKKSDTTLEGRGNGLILFKPGKRLKPDQWETLFNQFREMINYFQPK